MTAGVRVSGVQHLLHARNFISDIKHSIAVKCENILRSPDLNMHSLRDIINTFESEHFRKFRQIRVLVIASLCIVFKDVLPAYRIRPTTEKEKAQPTKKETRKIRVYEEGLLLNYRKYTDLLRVILGDKCLDMKSSRLKTYSKLEWSEKERLAAIKCVCQLLESHPDFNYSKELIEVLPTYLNSTKSQISSIITMTLCNIFENDTDRDVTLMICRAVHRFCRSKSYKVRVSVIKALSCIPITEVERHVESKKQRIDRRQRSRRERKESKMERKLEKEMAETQSLQTREKRLKMNTLVMNEILFVFFKILKTTSDSQLLSAIFTGLSKYSKLINTQYVDNLLSVLNTMIASKSTSILDSLHCVHTALCIMSSSDASDVLATDPTMFCNHLYTILGRIAGVSFNNTNEIESTTSHLSSVIKAYDRSNTPAAQAVADLVHRSKITESSEKPVCSSEISSVVVGACNRINADDVEHLSDTLISCLNILLVKRKGEVSINRILAFAKRLASAALAVSDPYCSSSLLIKLFHLLRLFPRCEVLFDCDAETCSSYKSDVNDPELCFPASACLWDLLLLKRHSDPVINQLANLIIQWGNDVCVNGIGATSTKQYILHINGKDISLDHLTHLSPDAFRTELKALVENDIAVAKMQPRKRMNTSDYHLSDSFTKYLSEYNLLPDVGLPTKKMRSS
ncbi:Nucleolar complex protein 3 [Schistosoma japonicum]|uniref:NOC3-like protein n=1 Tax=Schistosoma japonicum TaxID=6182 RepID=A0A4Z2DLF5_SCHJA|nr:Nucleolar complex protein 3 [Schistosoma japonicum]